MNNFLSKFRSEMLKLSDKERAGNMQAYMKTDQPFYGVQAANRKEILNNLLKEYSLNETELKDICWDLWNGEFREDMYASHDIIQKRQRILLHSHNFNHYVKYLERVSNWDQLDMIASNVLGLIYLKDRSFSEDISKWVFDKNMWIRRTSLLVHLKHKNQTDTEMLAFAIKNLKNESEFFIRKAIGWVLRSYGDFNPDWVRQFVKENPDLSNLSKKEALRKLV